MLIKTPQVNSGIMQVCVVLNLGNIHFVYEWSILTFSKRRLSHTSLFLSCLSKDHVLIICKGVWEEQRIHKHVLAKILVVYFTVLISEVPERILLQNFILSLLPLPSYSTSFRIFKMFSLSPVALLLHLTGHRNNPLDTSYHFKCSKAWIARLY